MRIALVHPNCHSGGAEIAKEACPEAGRVLGGMHATFMFKQVLAEPHGLTSSYAAKARRSS